MGQQIHPTGFRNGITKKYNSTWFANDTNYTKFLEEDYRIRYVLGCFFRSFFIRARSDIGVGFVSRSVLKAGEITKFEIRRTGTLLELLIHVGYPHFLATFPGWYKRLIENNLSFIQYATKVSIKLIRVKNPKCESSLVARSICSKLERRLSFRRILRSYYRQLSTKVNREKAKGFKIKVSGRLSGVEIARSEFVNGGQVPLQTLQADINYSSQEALTKYGIIGVKVWICKNVNL